jgi:hypothetical protein
VLNLLSDLKGFRLLEGLPSNAKKLMGFIERIHLTAVASLALTVKLRFIEMFRIPLCDTSIFVPYRSINDV